MKVVKLITIVTLLMLSLSYPGYAQMESSATDLARTSRSTIPAEHQTLASAATRASEKQAVLSIVPDWSTLFGGTGDTNGVSILVDASGNVWTAFDTTAPDMPTTADAIDRTYNGGRDIMVAKFSPKGDLLYSSYLGGSEQEGIREITQDDAGYIYLGGHTFSPEFMTTANAWSRTLRGGRDGVIVKLDPNGQLVYSTFLGGEDWDYVHCIRVFGGDIYVGGFTHGMFPITPGVAQPYFGGYGDGFLAKLHITPTNTTLVFSTYLGGYSWESIDSLALDDAGNIYITGGTHSTDFPTTPDAFDRVCNHCATNIKTDGFIAKFSPDGSQLLYSTLVSSNTATSGNMGFGRVLVNDSGEATVVGITTYADTPVTPDAFQPNYGGEMDIVIVKLNATGSALLYSSYFGGSGDDRSIPGAAWDTHGNLYLTGCTTSVNFPMLNPIHSTLGGGYDAFMAVFGPDNRLRLSTLWGGNQDDGCSQPYCTNIAIDASGNPYLIGSTLSPDFPTTPNAFDPTFNGTGSNGFVTKFTIANRMKVYLPMIVSPARATPLVWYDFEGDFLTTGIVKDRSGNRQDARVIGSVDPTSGISSGQAARFSGGYIQAQDNPAAGRKVVTFSLWFKSEHPEENYKLASAAWWNGGPASGWIMATHIPEFWSDDTQSLYLPDQPNHENNFPAGQWVHEAVTYDGVRIKEYTNGQLINDWATTGAAIGHGWPMAVGAWPQFSGYNFQGSLDEFQIFDRALTPEEIQAIYDRGRNMTITSGPALQLARMWHTTTRMPDGKILLVGGSRASDDFLVDVELFNPVTGISSLVAPLHTPRHAHTATLLPDGRVLVVGGYGLPRQWLDDAEVYDPATNIWTVVSPLFRHGTQHTATLMNDGRVLVVGGATGSSLSTERVEIFDPQTNAWTEAISMGSDRYAHTAQLLNDGRVLVAGGASARGTPNCADALLYDPHKDTWTATGPMVKQNWAGESVRLTDGRVLVAGGVPVEYQPVPNMTASVEIYNPASNAWTAAADLSQARYFHNLVPLPGNQVLAIGGVRDYEGCCWSESSFVREIESYDPVDNKWRTVGDLPQPRSNAMSILLPDGRAWVTGGRYMGTYWSNTWLVTPVPVQP